MSAPRRITFTRDGRRMQATEGQSVAAALYAHGDRPLSRSTKYHRPRGYSCGIGKCADCHMRVDGIPNVKTCITPARDGMRVEGQNAWPSVRHDLFRVNDIVWARGFDHHRAFIRPRFLYPLFGAVIRRFAGWGRIPDTEPPQPEVETLRPDVCVVGGGPAGLAAARAAASAGAQVLLVDENERLGGAVRRMGGRVSDPDAFETVQERHPAEIPVATLLARWEDEVRAQPEVRIEAGTTLAAAYRNGIALCKGKDRLLAVKAQCFVVCTGSYPAEAHFAHNERPGVLRVTAAMKLLHEEGVVPGRRAVVYGTGADGLAAASDLHAAGVQVVALVEPRGEVPGPAVLRHAVESADLPIFSSSHVLRVHGWSKVKAVTIETPQGRKRLRCDLMVVAVGRKTTPEVFQALGAALHYEPTRGGAVPVVDDHMETGTPGLFAAGDTSGIGTLGTARLSGRIAGTAAAARALGTPIDDALLADLVARLHALRQGSGGPSVPLEVTP